ncbi:hypothetical protein K2X83_01065 [Patescibacteria group bacterium]|nr:hypothetical protein [Patescibacteria group bacterium]
MNALRTHIGYVFAVLVVVLLVFIFFRTNENQQATYVTDDPALNAAYWEARITSRGAEAAYAEFKLKNAGSDEKQQHLAAHVMGEKIFESKGVSGVSVCDASFGFGCYHGFFGQALSQKGEGVVEELDRICVEKFGPLGTGCQHGLGHGILEYVGYQHIDSALSMCGKTTQKVPLLGCTSGVFMEYNSPLVGVGTGLVPRSRVLNQKNPYEPCENVPNEYKKSCFFELGGWLHTVSAGDYEMAADVCWLAPSPHAGDCALGFGASVPPSVKYDSEKARMVCDVFRGKNETACRAGTAWSFYSNPEYRRHTVTACESDTAEATVACMGMADLTEGLGGFPEQ